MGRTFLILVAACCPSWAADPAPAKAPDTGVQVTCHGKLRCGDVKIGAETTGTTIEFNGLKWELRIPDVATKRFAHDHHKDQVTVTGRLQRMTGVEVPVRWVLEVEQLTLHQDKDPTDTATFHLKGKLRPTAGAAPSTIEIGTDLWPIAWDSAPELLKKANGLAGNTVQAKGVIERDSNADVKNTPVLRIDQIQTPAAASKAVPIYQ